MSKIGFSSYSVRFNDHHWNYNIMDYFNIAKQINADGVMVDYKKLPTKSKELVELKERISDSDLYLEVETTGFEKSHLLKVLQSSRDSDAKLVRTTIGGVSTRIKLGIERWRKTLRKAQENLFELKKYVEENEIILAIENHCDIRTRELKQLVETVDSEYIGVCFDTGNQLFVLEDPLEACNELSEHVLSTHIKEYKIFLSPIGLTVEGTTLFSGDIPNKKIVSILKRESPLKDRLKINVEVPLERIPIPAFEKNYIKSLGEMDAATMGSALAYSNGKWKNEINDFKPTDKLLTEEHRNLMKSLRNARNEWS